MRTQMLYRVLSTAWSVLFLLAASFLIIHSSPLLADERAEYQMRELFKTAGPPPDAIINPLKSLANPLSAKEKLTRFWREKILGFRTTYAVARSKACFAIQRVVAGAVEMYNMDHVTSMMKALRHVDVINPAGVFVTGGYLKEPIVPTEPGCEFYSYGNLADNGIIYCTQHGTIEDYRTALIKVTGLKPYTASQENEFGFAVAAMAIFFSLTAVVLLALFYRQRKLARVGQPE